MAYVIVNSISIHSNSECSYLIVTVAFAILSSHRVYVIRDGIRQYFNFNFKEIPPLLLAGAVLENRILPSLYRSRKHSEKDVSSVVIHCRKFFSHFPQIRFGRITHNASLPDRWLQQVIFTFDQAAQPESSAVLSCYG